MLASDQLEFLMEAHSGLSAKIAGEAGFKGLWGSGLSISAMMGVRDSNEASWTQVLEVVEFMSDAVSIPILLDVDTGYGNFNNVRRLVRKLEQRNVAGMCMEDKIFPKANSYAGGHQPLAEIREFVGKIKAAKDTQEDPDFCVVARVEAFIAGRGLEEAIARATAYAEGGADAVLIHSKRPDFDEIAAFMDAWRSTCPVIIVPTTYFKISTAAFEESGVSLVIWANHLMRSSVAAMQRTARVLIEERSITAIESQVVTVQEIFRLQDLGELQRAEQRYLPDA
jgi:phosphoenolpyruvate phosphomutase